ALEVTFARCHHAMAPVFADHSNPIAGQIDGRRRLGSGRATLAAGLSARSSAKKQEHRGAKTNRRQDSPVLHPGSTFSLRGPDKSPRRTPWDFHSAYRSPKSDERL